MIFGITGRAGVGKSFLTHSLSQQHQNIRVVELDYLGHECLERPSIIEQLISLFGSTIFKDGVICRNTLGNIVFSNHRHLERLNAIIHPAIYELVLNRLHQYSQNSFLIVGALVRDILSDDMCQSVITIDAPDEDIFRCAEDSEKIKRIHSVQRSRSLYLDEATDVFFNSFSRDSVTEWQLFMTPFLNH